MNYARPSAEIAVMGAKRRIISTKDLPRRKIQKAKLKEKEQAAGSSPIPTATVEHGYVDRVIRPDQTRSKLISAFGCSRTKAVKLLRKKHGNIPTGVCSRIDSKQ